MIQAKLTLALLIFIFTFNLVNAEENCIPEYQCTSWSECDGSLTTRICTDVNCDLPERIERSFCENLGCTPNIECDSWAPCTYTQRTEDLIEGEIRFEGYRYRTCHDANGCIPSYQQEGFCEEENELRFSPITECNKEYLAISEPNSGNTLAKIDLYTLQNENRFDLQLMQGKTRYCDFCYNGILDKDKGEIAIDCGGECKPCREEKYILYALTIVFLWSGSLVFSFLSVREVIIMRKTKSSEDGQFQ